MWIPDAAEASYYETRAESHGAVYTTRIALDDAPGGTRLTMEFAAALQTFAAKAMGALFAPLMKGSMRKAIQKDLEDIKAAAERGLEPPEAPLRPHKMKAYDSFDAFQADQPAKQRAILRALRPCASHRSRPRGDRQVGQRLLGRRRRPGRVRALRARPRPVRLLRGRDPP